MSEPIAAHIHDDDGHHAVFVSPVRVLIRKSCDGGWFAQALEVDYVAGGTSADDVRKRFERGFVKTIAANLQRFGSLKSMFKPAPGEFWAMFLDGPEDAHFSCVSLHDLSSSAYDSRVPFDSLNFKTVAEPA
jgi:hypothetical protein